MKAKLLLLTFITGLLASCSSAYKTGQTPDDVYYSPTKFRAADEEVKREEPKEEDENYLRMKVRNRDRWNNLDDYDYWYDTRYDHSVYNPNRFNMWHIRQNCCCNNSWGYGWTSWGYNPYYPTWFIRAPYIKGNTKGSNLTAFTNKNFSNSNTYNNPKTGGKNNGFGNLIKKAFTSGGSNSNNGNSWDRPARTFSSGTKTSSSAGGSSGGFKSSGSSSSGGRSGRN
jgi:hypothetical protein